jgi:hypothetical protein
MIELKELATKNDLNYYFKKSGLSKYRFERMLGKIIYDLELEKAELVNQDFIRARKRLYKDLLAKKTTPIVLGYLEHKQLMELKI